MTITEESPEEQCAAAADGSPFHRGYRDERKGLGFLDNPFDAYSVEGRRWIDGFVRSMQDRRKEVYRAG